jgi:hypothetical protein
MWPRPSTIDHFGFLVDTPAIRALVAETERLTETIPDVATRVPRCGPFEALLASDGWLPSCAIPDGTSRWAAAWAMRI